MSAPSNLYTIGHSNHTLDRFIRLLKRHGIELLVDVRSKPYSRFCPHFRHDSLRNALESEGIEYRFLGKALGGKPEDERFYDDGGRPNYRRMAKRREYREGIDALLGLAQEQRAAMMCAEEDPRRCHRRFLITPTLLEQGVVVRHIRGDGRVETEEGLRNGERASADDQLALFDQEPHGF